MFDTHTHINSKEFESNRKFIIESLVSENIKAVIVGTDTEDSKLAKEIVKNNSNLRFSAGIHPHNSNTIDFYNISDNLENLILDKNNVAIGECGFDFYYNSKEESYINQLNLFEIQIKLAKKYDKPLIIHTRESFQETYDILSQYKDLTVIYHCFTGNLDWFYKLNSLSHNNFFSFAGIITFKNNVEDIQNTVRGVPMNQILSETDSPYLSPVPVRGKQNTSMNIKYIIAKIADLKGISFCKMEKILDNNATRVFKF